MVLTNVRKRGADYTKVIKCPKCSAPVTYSSVNSKKGDFCRKCGEFFDLDDSKKKLSDFRWEHTD